MSEGTLAEPRLEVGTSEFSVEFTSSVLTGAWRFATPLADTIPIRQMRALFASVMLVELVAEVRQDNLLGSEEENVASGGHIYVALIPSIKNTDRATGTNAQTVNAVPKKQTFPLSSHMQNNMIYTPSLEGYECDLAQDPRRGAGPIAWVGNSGIGKNGTADISICSITWRMKLRCSGTTPIF